MPVNNDKEMARVNGRSDAFATPSCYASDLEEQTEMGSAGLSKREYIAAGIMAQLAPQVIDDYATTAQRAVRMADALLLVLTSTAKA